MAKITGLGQGVGLLFNNEEEEIFFECNVKLISPNKHQPRSNFIEDDLKELADSIKEHGIIQPLIVSPIEGENSYDLIAGERRLRASKLLGMKKVPVVVRMVENEDSLLELALIENIQRTDLNPVEEAEAFNKLIEKFNYTQEEAARKLGKKRSTITNTLRLLNLPAFVKEDLIAGLLTEGHARALLRLGDDIVTIKDIRDQLIKKKLSVRQVEGLIRKLTAASKVQKSQATKKVKEIPDSYCSTLVNQLTNKLHSKVAISQSGNRGKIEIEYYSLDDLERLIGIVVKE
ncbi:MAG: ParB/RepB/Spo0J family partition protein [Bacteroidetes bacterium]|nr:ParB/RepB/Spo0J family partition protein [Bacteroidota bacterium]